MKRKNLLVVLFIVFLCSCASSSTNEEDITKKSEVKIYDMPEITTITSKISRSEEYIQTIETIKEIEEIDDEVIYNIFIPRNAILSIGVSGANFRENCSFDSKIIRKISSEDKLYIMDNCTIYDGFYKVTDGEYDGYIYSDYIFPKENEFYNKDTGEKQIFYNTYSGIIVDSISFNPADTQNFISKNDYKKYVFNNFKREFLAEKKMNLKSVFTNDEEIKLFESFANGLLNGTVILHDEEYNLYDSYNDYIEKNKLFFTVFDDKKQDIIFKIIFKNLYECLYFSENENFLKLKENASSINFLWKNNNEYDICIYTSIDLKGNFLISLYSLTK